MLWKHHYAVQVQHYIFDKNIRKVFIDESGETAGKLFNQKSTILNSNFSCMVPNAVKNSMALFQTISAFQID